MVKKRSLLILGGARSGKSSCAVRYAEACFRAPAIIVTAEALDAEMADRIRHHVAGRPGHWHCIEEPIDLAAALKHIPDSCDGVIIDCLTLWASNVMIRDGAEHLQSRLDALVGVIAESQLPMIFVSNEVGLGVVPASPLGRAFRDESGRMNQRVAAVVDDAVFVVSGLELLLKGSLETWKT